MLRSGRLAAPLFRRQTPFYSRQSQKGPFTVLTLAESFAALPPSPKGPFLVLTRAGSFAALPPSLKGPFLVLTRAESFAALHPRLSDTMVSKHHYC